jgi:hypothetical protein
MSPAKRRTHPWHQSKLQHFHLSVVATGHRGSLDWASRQWHPAAAPIWSDFSSQFVNPLRNTIVSAQLVRIWPVIIDKSSKSLRNH